MSFSIWHNAWLPIETVEGPQRRARAAVPRDKLQQALLWPRAGSAASCWPHQCRGPEVPQPIERLGPTTETFQIGYAPDQWDGLLKHLQQVEGLAPSCWKSWFGGAP